MNDCGKLASRVDYRRLASGRQTLTGTVALRQLPRVLAEMAADGDADAPVEVALALFEDGQRRVRIRGTVDARLRLVCQRCLGSYEQMLSPRVAGVVVGDDEAAANVPRADEPVLADGDVLDVYALVTDELLLAMPPVARCDRPPCRARYDSPPAKAGGKMTTKQNPFAVLKTLKRDT